MRRKDREVTDIKEIKQILDGCKTCHVAMIDGDQPYVIPLNYGYQIEDNTLVLYFHSAREGRKINILEKNNKVCFSITREGDPIVSETPCNFGYYFSSVIGNGEVEFIREESEKCEALTILFEQQSGEKVTFLPEQVKSICIFRVISKDYVGKKRS